MSKQHDQLEGKAAMEKRLGIAAETKKAAKKRAERWYPEGTITDNIGRAYCVRDFLAGVRWERRRRARRGG